VFPDERVREALQLMQHAPGEPITRSVARDVARREGAKALVSASIGRLGNNYVLSLEAVNAETGDVMAREQAEAASREDVLSSLGSAASGLRATLGESMAQVEKFDAPLARATTPSLEALHVYSLALDQGRANPRAEAIPYLRRAIELDPNFAMAHAFLSGVYANTGRFADAPAHARTAFELRNRVSERERFFISWRYYLDASQAWDAALDLAESWTAAYPREAFAFNSLGLASAAFGDHDRAVGAFREAIRLDPRFVPPHGNLAGSLIALNRFDEARAALDETAGRGIDVTGTRRAAFLLSLLSSEPPHLPRGYGGQANGTQDARRSAPDVVWTVTWEARAAASVGRFAAAHALYQRAVESALAGNLRDLAAQWTMEDAELNALAGRCDTARRRVAEGLEHGRDNFTLERASRALALCGNTEGASRLSAELAGRFPEATLTRGVQLPVTAAALSLERGDSAKVLELLEPVRPYDHAPSAEFWPTYLRGQASLQLRNGRAASGHFQEIIAHRGEAPTSPLFALAQLGLARAAAMTGDRDAARRAYDGFLAEWAGADRDLSPLSDARREYARLRE
jgi:tetratricopeptide (TPR) repeat protein